MKKNQKFLGGRQSVLVFDCGGCGKFEVIEGYEKIRDAVASELSKEMKGLFCSKCEEETYKSIFCKREQEQLTETYGFLHRGNNK